MMLLDKIILLHATSVVLLISKDKMFCDSQLTIDLKLSISKHHKVPGGTRNFK